MYAIDTEGFGRFDQIGVTWRWCRPQPRAPLAHVGRQAVEDATDILRVGLIVIDQVRQRQALHGTQAGFDRKLQFRFHARLVDKAGNTSTSASDTIVFDATNPTITSVSINNGDPYTTSLAVTGSPSLQVAS